MIGHRPIGEAGVGLHGGQYAVGECVHEGHQDVDEGQLAWVLGVRFLLWMPLGLDASPRVWGAQVLPFSWPDGVEGDLGGEEVFYGRFPGPGLTLEDKESCEAAGHHEGEQEEEDQGREVGWEVAAFQMDGGLCRPGQVRHQGDISYLGKDKTRVSLVPGGCQDMGDNNMNNHIQSVAYIASKG